MNDIQQDLKNDFELLEYFLSEIDKYVEEGRIEWKSATEMCEEVWLNN